MQARRQGCYHDETTTEMDRACFAERTTDNHQNGPSLDARWKEKKRKTENNMEKNSWERDESPAAPSGLIDEAGSGHAEAERLCYSPKHHIV